MSKLFLYDVLSTYKALKAVGDTDAEFVDNKTVKAICKNKNELGIEVEAFALKDRPSADYKRYLAKAEKLELKTVLIKRKTQRTQ